jgi:hypothetical protein
MLAQSFMDVLEFGCEFQKHGLGAIACGIGAIGLHSDVRHGSPQAQQASAPTNATA